MKKITLFTTLFLAVFCLGTTLQAQKVAIIGANTATPDGIAIVALENISSGTKIFLQTNPTMEVEALGQGKGFWSYTVPAVGFFRGCCCF
jgi:hypothetical protein